MWLPDHVFEDHKTFLRPGRVGQGVNFSLFDGNMELTPAAYNAGSRKVRQYEGVSPFKATRHYLKKIFEYYHY